MHDTHARALLAGLAWQPIADSQRARPHYELRPGTGRGGPTELWTRFDAAVQQLNHSGAGENLADVVAAYAAVAQAASELADALHAPGEQRGSRRPPNAGWRARVRRAPAKCSFARWLLR